MPQQKHYTDVVQKAIDHEIDELRSQQGQYQWQSQTGSRQDQDNRARDTTPPADRYAGAPPPAQAPAPMRSEIADEKKESVTRGVAATGEIVVALDQRIDRLQLVRDWIGEDVALAQLIDTVIGQQIRASEKRQTRLNIVMSTLSLIVGWGLSAIAAPSLLTTIFHP